MATPVYSLTFGQLKIEILRAVGDLVAEGTADAGAAGTLDDAVLASASDQPYLGGYIYLYDGPGQGDARDITAFTPASDRVSVTPNFSATPTTSTKYFISRRFHPLALQSAIRRSLIRLGKYAKDYVDQSLILGSPLVNGSFYDNTGTFPNGWTRTGTGGTFTRITDLSKHGRYACQIVSNGTNAAGIQQSVPNIGRYRGRSLEFRGWVRTVVASRVSITIDDGVTTQTSDAITATNEGWGSFELTTGLFTVSNYASQLIVAADISSGSAVTAQFSGLWVPADVYEWNLPAGSPTLLYEANYEIDNGHFTEPISMQDVDKLEESTRRIRLLRRYPAGRILELKGRTSWADFATQASDDDTTFDGDVDWLIKQSAAYLLESARDDRSKDFQRDAGTPPAVALPMNPLILERN